MKQVYLNPKQLEFTQARQKNKIWLGGRGSAKSSTIAFETAVMAKQMPRAKGFFTSTTYNQILTKTLPAVKYIWRLMGLKEYISPDDPGHYVIGRIPPKGWTKAYFEPENYKNVISFFNGFCIELLSMDRPDLARGGSYDFGFCDEACLVKRESVTQVLVPSIRANKHRFTSPKHHSMSYFTSMPWKASGQWVLDYKQKHLDEPDKYFWIESTAYDNIEVLGAETIQRWKDEMPYHEFMVEVENKPILKSDLAYYPRFNEDNHCYSPNYGYEDSASGILVGDYQRQLYTNKKIDLSVDLGGWFNCFSCYQAKNKTEFMFDALYVKAPDGIDQLVDQFCFKYQDHSYKVIDLYGEPRGHDRNPSGETYFNKIKRRFKRNGWICNVKAHSGRTTDHHTRKNLMDDILSEENNGLPKLRINEQSCKWVCLAIILTKTTSDGKKDKSLEKKKNQPQEKAPHITDTIDYYFTQKHKRINYPSVGAGAYFG